MEPDDRDPRERQPQLHHQSDRCGWQYRPGICSAGSDHPRRRRGARDRYVLDRQRCCGDHITNDNTLTLSGTAVANSTVKVFDGTTQIATATANSSGAWSSTATALLDGNHNLTATATNASGTSTASAALAVTIDTVAPNAPVEVGDSIVNGTQVQLTGTAEANSTLQVYDGTTLVGTTTTNATGNWTAMTSPLSPGAHDLTATATDVAGNTSAVSLPLDPVIGTNGSNLVVNGGFETGSFGGWTLGGNFGASPYGDQTYIITGAGAQGGNYAAGLGPVGADGTLTQNLQTVAGQHYTLDFWLANASSGPDDFTVKWNGQVVSALVNKSAQAYTEYTFDVVGTSGTSNLEFDFRQDPSHWSLDNVSVTATGSQPLPGTPTPVSTVGITNLYENANLTATIKGTADASSQIKLYDGTKSLGTVTTAADGTWSFTTTSAVSNSVHAFTAQEVNTTGQVVASSGSAVLGSTHSDTLTSTAGNDYFVGNGSADTFVFAANFGNDLIKDFIAGGRGHDVIQFSTSVFNSFASVLAHASQIGQDVVISADAHELADAEKH